MSIRDELADLLEALDDCDYMDLADTILARYAVVELPEPHSVEDPAIAEDLEGPFEFRAPWGTYYVVRGKVESDSGPMWSPGQARREAAALLAAANRAETQS